MKKICIIKIFLYLVVCPSSFSHQLNSNQTLIIGELSGRVDYNDIEQQIKNNYYPISLNPEKNPYRLIKANPSEAVFEYINPSPLQPKKIIIRFFNSEMALEALIIIDEIDFARTESAKIAAEVHKTNPGIRVKFQNKRNNFVKMIAYNNDHVFFKNINVRIALSYAINKQYILEHLLNSQASITSGPIDKTSNLYLSEFKEYKFNPQRAIKLLEKEGWIDKNQDGIRERNGIPFKFTLIYERGVLPDEDMVRMIKLDWNKLGIDVSIKPLIKREIKDVLNTYNFDAILTNYQFTEDIESFQYLFDSKSQSNFLNYHNKMVDRYFDLYKRVDVTNKKTILQGIVNIIIQEQPASFLFFLWMDWLLINAIKFNNFLDKDGNLAPFNEWEFKR